MDIYLYSSQSSPALDSEGRDGLEDDIGEFLGDAGSITGGGAGTMGWNVDIEVTDDDWEGWLPRLIDFLRGWGVPRDSYFRVYPPGWENGMDSPRVDVFPPPPSTPLERAAFLADPEGLVWVEGVEPAWVAEAFRTNKAFRETALEGLAWSATVCRNFGKAGGWLALLGAALTSPEEVRHLYQAIAARADIDTYGRQDFTDTFPGRDGLLPLPPEAG